MAKKASSGKVEFWTAAIELFSESTLNCREFCDREGLSYSTFCRWQERLTNKADVNTPSLLSSEDLPKESTSIESGDEGKSESPGDDVKFVSAGVIVAGDGRKNYLFVGSNRGGHTAAVIYSLIESAKRHKLNPFEYLRDILQKLPDTKISDLDKFLPDKWNANQSQALQAQ